MKRFCPFIALIILVITATALTGCISSKATEPTIVTTVPTTEVPVVNTTVTPTPVPAENLTPEDIAFLRNSIDKQGVSIRMIADTLSLIRSGHYDSARTLAESTEKTLKLQYANLSEQSVSPSVQPVKDEILAAMRDEINGSRKLRNIAISDSEMMSTAAKDYSDAADELFRSANVRLNNAQAKLNDLQKK
jgi:hypothetical protein